MNKKVYIKTWGCQMNEYDSTKIVDLLNVTHKYHLTTIPEEADILLLNTCSIREKAQEKVFHQLGRWKDLKSIRPEIIIGVGGCVAAQEGKYIFDRNKCVDIIFGPQTLHRLPKMINHVKQTKSKIIDISFPEIEKFNYFPITQAKRATAYVSIMEGCNKYCSFCVVPYTRGREISRPFDDIVFEIYCLAEQGVREINLLGQNVNAYQGIKHNGEICNFSELVKTVSVIDGIDRIRYITSHPVNFTEDIINLYYNTPKLVSFLHLPVQSGSDRILSLMKRDYTVSEYKSIIHKLRKARPNIQISSDFIVGFPGETEEDFEQTMNLISDVNFDMSFSFIYSPRPGTPAAEIKDNIDKEEKKRRLHILQKRIMQQAIKFSRRMHGTIQNVLVEGISYRNNTKLYGKTENNRIVNFHGNSSMIGKIINVKITDVHLNLLEGKIIFQ